MYCVSGHPDLCWVVARFQGSWHLTRVHVSFGNAPWRLWCLYDLWLIYTYIQSEPRWSDGRALTSCEGSFLAAQHWIQRHPKPLCLLCNNLLQPSSQHSCCPSGSAWSSIHFLLFLLPSNPCRKMTPQFKRAHVFLWWQSHPIPPLCWHVFCLADGSRYQTNQDFISLSCPPAKLCQAGFMRKLVGVITALGCRDDCIPSNISPMKIGPSYSTTTTTTTLLFILCPSDRVAPATQGSFQHTINKWIKHLTFKNFPIQNCLQVSSKACMVIYLFGSGGSHNSKENRDVLRKSRTFWDQIRNWDSFCKARTVSGK